MIKKRWNGQNKNKIKSPYSPAPVLGGFWPPKKIRPMTEIEKFFGWLKATKNILSDFIPQKKLFPST